REAVGPHPINSADFFFISADDYKLIGVLIGVLTGSIVTLLATVVLCRPARLGAAGLSPALDRGAHRSRAILRNKAAFLGWGEQVIAHLVRLFVKLTAGN